MDPQTALNIWGQTTLHATEIEPINGRREITTITYEFDPDTNVLEVTWESPSQSGGVRYLVTPMGIPPLERPPVSVDPAG